MPEKKKTHDEQSYLNAIDRTRLLFSTHDSLCEEMGYSTSTKYIGNIGGKNNVLKKAMFAYLDAQYAKTVSPEIDLKSLLDDYDLASDYAKKCRKHTYFKKNKDNCLALIEHFCTGQTDCDDNQVLADLHLLDTKDVGMDNFILPIMLLILWEVIPTFNTKSSHDIADIAEDCKKMFMNIENAIKASKILHKFPVIDRYRKEFEVCMANAEEYYKKKENREDSDNQLSEFTDFPSRLRLIHSLRTILLVLYNNSSPEILIEANNHISQGFMDLCGYWKDVTIMRTDDDVSGRNKCWELPTIWHFESEDKSNYVVKQVIKDTDDPDGKYYRTYQMSLWETEVGKTLAAFLPREGMERIVESGMVPPESYIVAEIDSQTSNGTTHLTLTCYSDNKWFESRKMEKIIGTAKCDALFNDLIPSPGDFVYEPIDCAYAVTEDHVYFRVPNSENFYKVPRIEHFENTDIYNLILYTSRNRIFIGCPMTNKYVDLTDETQLENKGISVIRWTEETVKPNAK